MMPVDEDEEKQNGEFTNIRPIEGLPEGAILRPINPQESAEFTNIRPLKIEGLPAGARLVPIRPEPDWFDQNAPAPRVAARGGDWFDQNAPPGAGDQEKIEGLPPGAKLVPLQTSAEYRPPGFEAAQETVAGYPREFQESEEAQRARGEPADMSQRALTERLWGPLTRGLISPGTITRAVSGWMPVEAQRRMEAREAAGKAPGWPGMALSAGRVLSPLTSPVSLGTMAAGPLSAGAGPLGTAARATLLGAAPALAVQGGQTLLRPRAEDETEREALERRFLGGAQLAGGLGGTAEGLKLGGRILGPLARRAGGAIAERTAQSMLGAEAPGTPFVSRPAPAMVAEGPIAVTRGGLIKQLGGTLKGYQKTLEETLDASAGAAPEPLRPIVERATQAEIDRAKAAGYKSVASAIEKWRDDYLEGKPESVSDKELYKLRQRLGEDTGLFKQGQATREEIGLDRAQRQVYRAMNQTLDRRMPGFRDITERQSGLIRARGMLENRARLAAGRPLLPSPHIYVGEGGVGSLGRVPFLGGRIRLGLPEGTLPKTLLIRGLGRRVPLAEPTPAGVRLGPIGRPRLGGP